MKTYTIDANNNITVFASKKEAAAVSATPFDPFTSQSELAEVAADWPANRLVEIWNRTERIWKAIQRLGAAVPPGLATQSEATRAEPVAQRGS